MRGTLNAVSTLMICAAGLLLASVQSSLSQIPNPNACLPSSYIFLDVFADSNATVFLDNQVLIPGEQVYYQAALLPGAGVCALSNGFFVITTPDGTNHVVGASIPAPGPIPVTCGGGPPCNQFVLSEAVPYTVSTQDLAACDLGGIPLPTAVAASANVTNVTFICGNCSGFSIFQICNPVEIPCLQVVKLVACQPAGGICSNADFKGFAKGVKTDSQIPAFCYSITITNCGTDNLTITNVSDSVFGDIAADFTNSTGALGSTLLETNEAATIYFPTDLDRDTTNTVTVLGVENDSGFDFPVDSSASATAQVVQASLSCTLSASSADSLAPSEGCAVKLISNGSGHVVDYSILVTNTGSAILTNVTLTSGSLPLTCGLTPPNPRFVLPVGGATNIVCHETFFCNGSPINIRLLAVAGQVLTNQDVCALDSNGVPVQAVSTCSVAICCAPCTLSCSVSPPSATICAGQMQTFTVTPSGGTGPFQFLWNTGATTSNITVSAADTYTVKVTDANGCTNSCSALLTTNPNPTCDINPKTPVCALTTNTYCSTVSPAGGVVTHSWSITGSGTITNANHTGACVTVVAGASGSYTVTDHTTRDGCPGSCSQEITVNPAGQIGDFVWNDLNGNGCQDAGEPGIAGVKVDLYSGTCGGTRTLIKTTNTDGTGHYLFSGLCPGEYQVAITTPSGFTATTPLAGCAVNPSLPPDRNQTDSKCNCAGASPCFICVTLTPANPNNLNVDCGYIPSCALEVIKTGCIIQPLVTNVCPCSLGYPFASANPRTSVVFNESEVLVAFSPCVATSGQTIKVWYSDEHALLLGARRVIVKTASVTTTNDYPVSPLLTNPGSIINPQVGTTNASGDQAGNDPVDRPLRPSLFLTDITADPASRAGDWQFGGTAIAPSAVFGTWKAAVKTVDRTRSTPVVTIVPDGDPAANGSNLGSGDPAPAGSINQKFGAEARWDVDSLGLLPGHIYRVQFMVHDGDQNKVGGDVGEKCAQIGFSNPAECTTTFSSPDCVEVAYTYQITNDSGSPANNVTVIDDPLGQVPGSPIATIGAGQSVTLMATSTVCCTTTNKVTVTSDDGCVAMATALIKKCAPLGACTPPYPFASPNPLTSIAFNESEVLRTAVVSVVSGCIPDTIQVFYNDEHALTLGIRQVVVKTKSGTTTTNFPITAMGATNPAVTIDPLVGSTNASGDLAGTDLSGRPMFPALFITDITGNPSSLAGDWQFGGTAIAPHAVFGTWKSAVKIVDKTKATPVVTVTPDADPAKNDYDLGAGSDPVPSGLVNQGYGAEVRWNVASLGLQMGHTYRLYFMVHDGDQNKSGGDVGQGCAILGVGTEVTGCTPTPPPAKECTSGIVAFKVKYTGASSPGPVALTFTGSQSALVTTTYNFPSGLANGTVLTMSSEHGFTIDATAHAQIKLGTKTSVYFNGVLTEILHTSCSCRMNNFIPGQPACLDASSPDNPTGTKGEPSPLFQVLDFK